MSAKHKAQYIDVVEYIVLNYDNKSYKEVQDSTQLTKDDYNLIIRRVAYKYSQSARDAFFEVPELALLFSKVFANADCKSFMF